MRRCYKRVNLRVVKRLLGNCWEKSKKPAALRCLVGHWPAFNHESARESDPRQAAGMIDLAPCETLSGAVQFCENMHFVVRLSFEFSEGNVLFIQR